MSIAVPRWEVEGADWPNRAASHFVRAAGMEWHVQTMGTGRPLLLIHGTGAATHSWRDLAPLLAKNFRIIAFDLPGHGFTTLPAGGQLTLPGMASAISALLRQLAVSPDVVVGHSAGAAIAARMTAEALITPQAIISLNGALQPFPDWGAVVFPALARLLFLNPFVPAFFAWRARDEAAVERLIAGTGSKIDARGIDLYARLLRTSRHVAATLGMMAKWDLHDLQRLLHRLTMPVFLVACDKDRAIAPAAAEQVRMHMQKAQVIHIGGLGHLAHEEAPERFAALIGELSQC